MIAHACPRCGYDQSGAIPTWKDSCPISSVCSECGYEFLWRDLLNPEFSRSLRLFEHARNRHVRCLILTVWKAQRPWSFWRWVRMEHAFIRRRAVIVSLIGILVAYAVLASATSGMRILGICALNLLDIGSLGIDSYEIGWAMRASLLWPFGDPGDFWYGSWWMETHSMAWLWIGLLFLIAFAVPGAFRLLPDTLRAARVKPSHLSRVTLYTVVSIPAVGFASFWLVAIPAIISAATDALGMHDPGLDDAYWWAAERFRAISALAVLCWIWVAWTFACARYLKLPHSAAVGFAMVLVTTLAVLFLGMLTPTIREALVADFFGG